MAKGGDKRVFKIRKKSTGEYFTEDYSEPFNQEYVHTQWKQLHMVAQ